MPRTSKIKLTKELRDAYEQRDRRLDNSDAPVLPPEMWENAVIGRYYRPIKTPISLRIDADLLAWLKTKGENYNSRINSILRQAMLEDARDNRGNP